MANLRLSGFTGLELGTVRDTPVDNVLHGVANWIAGGETAMKYGLGWGALQLLLPAARNYRLPTMR